MIYKTEYMSPLGKITAAANGDVLTGLWFENQKYFPTIAAQWQTKDTEIFIKLHAWLDDYFAGADRDIDFKLDPQGTDFQREVWALLLEIPHGKFCTYGDIADKIAKRRGIDKFAARPVGTAVGRNPISIIIPCHRVIGSTHKLTGYAGGLDRKQRLLEIEQVTLDLHWSIK